MRRRGRKGWERIKLVRECSPQHNSWWLFVDDCWLMVGNFFIFFWILKFLKILKSWFLNSWGPDDSKSAIPRSGNQNFIDFGRFEVSMKNQMKIMKNLYFLRISDNLEVLIQLLRSKYVHTQCLRSTEENCFFLKNWKSWFFLLWYYNIMILWYYDIIIL